MKETKQTFVKGAFVLIFANLIVKVIGALFKIPLHNAIGAVAMSYFQQAYNYYALFFMISTAGLPVAISRMIAASNVNGNHREVEKIYTLAMRLFFGVGLAGSLILAGLSHTIANAVAVPELYVCILAISPTLFFISMTSACRGYFQGLQNMVPTAVSQTIEAASKLVIGLGAGIWAKSQGYSDAIVASVVLLAITLGVVFSFIYVFLARGAGKKQRQALLNTDLPVRSSKSLLKELVIIAIPITLSSSIMYLTSVIDSSMVIRRLMDIGHAKETAQAIFGSYGSMAVTMYNLPPNFVNPFAISLIPQIAASLAKGAKEGAKKAMDSTLRFTSTIILPCAFGMGALSERLLALLYVNESIPLSNGSTLETVPLAGQLLKILAPCILFVSIIYVTSAMLQASGNEKLSIVSAALGVTTKLIATYVLLGIPAVGIYGTPISTGLCYLVIVICNFFFLVKKTGYRPSMSKLFFRPLLAGIACGASAIGFAWLFDCFLPYKLATIGAIGAAALVYLAVLFLVKGVNEEDVILLPKGEAILRLLKRCKLL